MDDFYSIMLSVSFLIIVLHKTIERVLLDLDEQWVRFYLNGARCGGIASGVTGPLVRAVQVKQAGTVVLVVPSYEQARTASR